MNSDSHTSPDAASQLRHDLKTPVNHIIGYSEMLLEDAEECGNESSASDLKKIRFAAQELLGLINTRLTSSGLAETPKSANASPLKFNDFKRAERTFHGRVLAVDDNRENLDVLARDC